MALNAGWQRTFGPKLGAYLRDGDSELYVKLAGPRWRSYVDGTCVMPDGRSESAARAEAEAALRRRRMVEAGAARVTAAAGKPRRVAGVASNP